MSEPVLGKVKKTDKPQVAEYTLWQIVMYFLKLGTIGFGGPVALANYMHRDLVEQRKWISEDDYKDGLALAQLSPGPLAAQLGIYLGYVHYSFIGATLVGIAFALPSFIMVVAIGWAYVQYGGLTWMQAVFYAVGASVIGIIAFSAYKLTTKTVGKKWLLIGIYLTSAIFTAVTESESIVLILAGGIIVLLVKAPPQWLKNLKKGVNSIAVMPLAFAIAKAPSTVDTGLLWQIFWFFTKAGAFVFGSGLAIVPFLYSGVVVENQWLNAQEFVDAVAVAMITPGPVVITTGFIGYLLHGFSGATIAALATFLPAYLLTIIPAPLFKKYGKLPSISAFVEGVTTGAVGAITGAVIVLGQRSIYDIPTALFAIVTLGLLWKFKKISEPIIILGAAVLGLIIYPLLHS
ncbi:chromate transporter [Cytobacillus firmus]|uniref:chromate transporter n=1 Tax=Cytobacillus firmus TaxID=1399 RepID=UPI0034A3D9C0